MCLIAIHILYLAKDVQILTHFKIRLFSYCVAFKKPLYILHLIPLSDMRFENTSRLQLIFSYINSASLNIFKIADLQSLSSKSNVWASTQTIYITFFFSVWVHTFLVLCIPCSFMLKTGHVECCSVATLEIRFFLLRKVCYYCLLWLLCLVTFLN